VLGYDTHINAKIKEPPSEIEDLKSITQAATCVHDWRISHICGPRDNNEYDYIYSKCGRAG
jgi:hypothetical protein